MQNQSWDTQEMWIMTHTKCGGGKVQKEYFQIVLETE